MVSGVDLEQQWRYDRPVLERATLELSTLAQRLYHDESKRRALEKETETQGQLGKGPDREQQIRFESAKSTFFELMGVMNGYGL